MSQDKRNWSQLSEEEKEISINVYLDKSHMKDVVLEDIKSTFSIKSIINRKTSNYKYKLKLFLIIILIAFIISILNLKSETSIMLIIMIIIFFTIYGLISSIKSTSDRIKDLTAIKSEEEKFCEYLWNNNIIYDSDEDVNELLKKYR